MAYGHLHQHGVSVRFVLSAALVSAAWRQRLALAVLCLSGCNSVIAAESDGGSDAGSADSAGAESATGLAAECSQSLADSCQHSHAPCVANFDSARLCSSWPGFFVQIDEQCAGYHVAHVWSGEAESLYFYDGLNGDLVALGYQVQKVGNYSIACAGGPIGSRLPQTCLSTVNAGSCVKGQDAGTDAGAD